MTEGSDKLSLLEGVVVGQPLQALSKESHVRFRVRPEGVRWNQSAKMRDHVLPSTVFVDLDEVVVPDAVLLGEAKKVSVLGVWRHFRGAPARPGRAGRLYSELVAHVVEVL